MNRKQRRAESNHRTPPPPVAAADPSTAFAGTAFAEAFQHHQAGRLVEAEPLYRKVLTANSRHADSLHMLGVLAQQTGCGDVAIDFIGRAIAIDAKVAAYHSDLGKVLLDRGRLDEARASLHRALDLKPDLLDAHNTLGVTLDRQGRPDEAAECYRRAMRIYPDSPLLHVNLGKVLKERGRLDEAVGCYRRALALEPDYPEAYDCLGLALEGQGRPEEAVACFRRAVELEPNLPNAHSNLGAALQVQGRLDEAVACFRRALALEPDYPEAHSNLGSALGKLGHLDEAVACCRRAIELKPDLPMAHTNLGFAFTQQGHLEEALRHYAKAIVIKPNHFPAFSNLLFLVNYLESQPPASLCDMARQFGILASREVGGRAFATWPDAPSGGALRVGLVSGDLHHHPVAFWLEGLLRAVDPARIAFVAFPTGSHEDDVTARIKPFFKDWAPIHSLGDEAAANLIHASGVQVLLDLSGHTGYNRLPMFAWRPAPVQATWLGYFATTGIAEMDYIVGNKWLLPATESAHFTETAWLLADVVCSYTPPAAAVEVSDLPALSANRVTFGCFNNLNKVNDAVVAVWARVLKAVPLSRLMLKARQFNEEAACSRMRARFAAHGIDEDRLLLEPASPRIDYLRAYHRIDIALDPFPYPGGTTSSDTLWMGVPLLTKKGHNYLSHAGEYVVHNVGLPDWIAADDDDYVAKAAGFASDIGRLAALRAILRQQMLASPLCNSAGLARNFEDAMWGMWSRPRGGRC
jgi:predicted O-linked N-acetylglucosamine transferase (SPINDLY family)